MKIVDPGQERDYMQRENERHRARETEKPRADGAGKK
jgi:hypothetical protein